MTCVSYVFYTPSWLEIQLSCEGGREEQKGGKERITEEGRMEQRRGEYRKKKEKPRKYISKFEVLKCMQM